MRKFIYIFVALLLPSFALLGQNVAVKAVLDTNFLMIGEQTQFHFIATYQNKNTQIKTTYEHSDLFKPFIERKSNSYEIRKSYFIRNFLLHDWFIRKFKIIQQLQTVRLIPLIF